MYTITGDLNGRRVRADGALLGTRLTIAAGPTAELMPQVIYNSRADHYLAVWIDTRTPSKPAVYGRRLRPNGSPLGTDFPISGPDAVIGAYEPPAVAFNPAANQYLVVWSDLRDDHTRGQDIYGRRLRANGTAIGGDFLISGPGADDDEEGPAVAYSAATNQYLVVWGDGRDYDRGDDIYGRRVKANGVPAKSDFRISGATATEGEGLPALAYNSAAEEYLVVWTDRRNQGLRDIYGQRVPATGRKIGGNFRISRGPDQESSAAVAYSTSADEYLVVWADGRNLPTRSGDIFGRRVAADGTPLDKDFRLCGPAATGNDRGPAVAYGPGEYLVVWSSFRESDWAIYGIRVDGQPSA